MPEKKWWHDAVVYQVYPRSFLDTNGDGIGDLPGVLAKLDYLQLLGVNVIWLSPVFKSPMDDNGYDIADYQDIAPEFGSMADMDRLIEQARARGIGIVMDLVVNHTSDEHPWFRQALSAPDNPYRDYYIWRKPAAGGGAPDASRGVFGGSAWELDSGSGEYFYHHFSKRQPDLNWANPRVQQEVHAMMNWWLARGIAGFRMDVIDLIGKDVDQGRPIVEPRVHELLQQMHRDTFGPRDVLTVGEVWSATPASARLYSDPARAELSMVFQFEHVTLSHDAEHGKWKQRPFDLVKFKAVISKWQLALNDAGWNSLFLGNHDLPRAVSQYGDDGRYRVASARMLATALHCLKGTPYIYQGEEIGMTNVAFDGIDDYRDIETLNLHRDALAAGVPPHEVMARIHKSSRDNARTPMPWHGGDQAGFSTGTPWIPLNPNHREVNVATDLASDGSVFRHYQRLIALRRGNELLVYGDYVPLLESHPQVFAYLRRLGSRRLACINNFSDQVVELPLPAALHGVQGKCLISNHAPRDGWGTALELLPYESFAIEFTSPE